MKYLTQQTWKPVFEPVSELPSLTRVSDYESIESMFARFKATEGLFEVFRPIAQLSPDEQDVLYHSTDLGDLADEDLTVQKEFVDSVKSSLTEAASKKEEKNEPTQAQPEPEKNPATEPEDA